MVGVPAIWVGVKISTLDVVEDIHIPRNVADLAICQGLLPELPLDCEAGLLKTSPTTWRPLLVAAVMPAMRASSDRKVGTYGALAWRTWS